MLSRTTTGVPRFRPRGLRRRHPAWLRLAPLLLLPAAGATAQSWAQSCYTLEAQGRLLHQVLQTSRVCVASTSQNWTDCMFAADGTRIHIVSAGGRESGPRAYSPSRTGFYVVAVDPRHFVRPVLDAELGLVIRVEDKSIADEKATREETHCGTNAALLTLDSRVLSEAEERALRAKAVEAMPEDAKIRRLQQGLIDLGLLDGPADGILGPKTRAALDVLRQKKGIAQETSDDLVEAIVAVEAMREAGEDVQ